MNDADMSVDTDLAARVYAYAVTSSESDIEHDQSVFVNERSCGTTMCLAGFAQYALGGRDWARRASRPYPHTEMAFLALTGHSLSSAFMLVNDVFDRDRAVPLSIAAESFHEHLRQHRVEDAYRTLESVFFTETEDAAARRFLRRVRRHTDDREWGAFTETARGLIDDAGDEAA